MNTVESVLPLVCPLIGCGKKTLP